MKNRIINTISIVLSIIVTIFIWHEFLISGNTIILVLFLPIFYVFFKKILNKGNKRLFIIAGIIAILFSIVELACTSINTDYTFNHIFNKWTILNFLGYAILAWSVISYIYISIINNKYRISNLKFGKVEFLSDSKKSFFLNILLILLAWIPYFLRYYPGLLTLDSCVQMAQAIGQMQLTNHHPIFHTGLISIFVNIGRGIFNNINAGVAFYIVFQMIAMAIMFAYVLKYISKKGAPLLVKVIVLIYYMFYPINPLFCITMWKDILFAGIIPIYIITTIELISDKQEFLKNKKKVILYITISILVMFLRNNGLYVVLLSLPLIFIIMRKYWKKIVIILGAIVILYFSLKTLIFSCFNVKEGNVGEMLSIPLQQIARVKKYHKEELGDEITETINEFFKCDDIENKYNPILSDPVKDEFDNEYFNKNKGKFVELWLKLLGTYFKDYMESFISNSYGYYYPEAKHWVANRTMEENNMGIVQQPLIKGSIVSKVDSLIERRDIPLISMIFSIGTAFWVIIVSLGYSILQKNYDISASYWIIFILWLTIVASPVFCEFRYAYPMFTSLPLYISLNFVKKEKRDGKNSSINTML